jgi:hypothetical protein
VAHAGSVYTEPARDVLSAGELAVFNMPGKKPRKTPPA